MDFNKGLAVKYSHMNGLRQLPKREFHAPPSRILSARNLSRYAARYAARYASLVRIPACVPGEFAPMVRTSGSQPLTRGWCEPGRLPVEQC